MLSSIRSSSVICGTFIIIILKPQVSVVGVAGWPVIQMGWLVMVGVVKVGVVSQPAADAER